jgi:hypothetical protein
VKNLVGLPYNRVAVQRVRFGLESATMCRFFDGKEVWFETEYVVFRNGDECAIVHLAKREADGFFSTVSGVDIVSLPDSTSWIDDASVDAGNASALAEKARALGIGPTETLVVNGLYEHVCFIHRPDPVVIDVFDLSPPEPPRLLNMARQVLAYKSFPPTVIRPHIQPILDLARDVAGRTLLFPCGISQLKRTTEASYLDERPDWQEWVLVGCERSRQIHQHFYGRDCPRIELCPRRLFNVAGALVLMRCCSLEKKVDLTGRVALVPWGAELQLVEQAIASLIRVATA